MKYRLTAERRAELLAWHVDEFGDTGHYNERSLLALYRAPDVIEPTLDAEDQPALEMRMHAGHCPPSEDADIVVLMDEYHNGHLTLDEVS